MPNSALSDAHVSMLSSKSGALQSAQLPPKMLHSIPKHTGALAKTTQCAWTHDNLPEMLKRHEKSTHNKGKNELTTQNGTVQRWYGPPENELSSVVFKLLLDARLQAKTQVDATTSAPIKSTPCNETNS